MKRKVPPTRMELLRIRKRLGIAVRGHKLLKDKLEGIIKEVTERLAELKKLRLELDDQFPEAIELFTKAGAIASPAAAETAAAQSYPGGVLQTRQDRIMGVPVTRLEFTLSEETQPYNLDETSPYLDAALVSLRELMPRIVELAAAEDAVRRLADELGRTRRRTNALEYSVIPDLRATRRLIEARLEEYTRSDISRLMKVKEMLLARDQTTPG
ncbi:MAG TPA: V-type ATP synthase subunit D [Planctomycetota bacterium]|nr:V-type ATP synthase subunit D [Planctomycetota bacterium]